MTAMAMAMKMEMDSLEGLLEGKDGDKKNISLEEGVRLTPNLPPESTTSSHIGVCRYSGLAK